MTENQIPHANFGRRPQVSPLGKIKGIFTAVVSAGALVSAAVYLGTILLPDGYTPGDVAGKMAGNLLNWEINTSVDAHINKVRREAVATASANAEAQADLAMFTAAVNTRAQALAPLEAVATVSDVACISSQRFAQTASRDWQDVLGMVAQVTCGVSAVVRPAVVASTIEAGTTVAAARGMPLRDASVAVHPVPSPAPQTVAFPQPRAVPAPATPPQAGRATVTPVQAVIPAKPTMVDLLNVMTISQASRHYDPSMVAEAEKIARTLPPEIQRHLRDGAAAHDDDVFCDRIVGLIRLAKAM